MTRSMAKIDELLLRLQWDEVQKTPGNDFVSDRFDNNIDMKCKLVIDAFKDIYSGIKVNGGLLLDYDIIDIENKGKGMITKQDLKKGEIFYIYSNVFAFNEKEFNILLKKLLNEYKSNEEDGINAIKYILSLCYCEIDDKRNIPCVIFECCDSMLTNHNKNPIGYSTLKPRILEPKLYSKEFTYAIANCNIKKGTEITCDYSEWVNIEWFNKICKKYGVLTNIELINYIDNGTFKRGKTNYDYTNINQK